MKKYHQLNSFFWTKYRTLSTLFLWIGMFINFGLTNELWILLKQGKTWFAVTLTAFLLIFNMSWQNLFFKFCLFFLIWPPAMRPRGGNKFHNLHPCYPRDASNKNRYYWPCGFQEVKKVNLLTHNGRRLIAIGHLSDSSDLKPIYFCSLVCNIYRSVAPGLIWFGYMTWELQFCTYVLNSWNLRRPKVLDLFTLSPHK